MRVIKYIFFTAALLAIAMMLALGIYTTLDRLVDYDVATDNIEIPKFQAVELPFEQQHDRRDFIAIHRRRCYRC